MSTLDALKDPRSIASISALIGVGASWIHFRKEIESLKQEQATMQEQLDQLESVIDPTQINQTMQVLTQRLNDLDVRMSSRTNDFETRLNGVEKSSREALPTYQRFTNTRQQPYRSASLDKDQSYSSQDYEHVDNDIDEAARLFE